MKKIYLFLHWLNHCFKILSRNFYDERPWGSYKVLDSGPGYQIKIITVNPKQRLSLQSHEHRNETWVVLSGLSVATIGDEDIAGGPGSEYYVPNGAKHRMFNPGTKPLVFAEVQLGKDLSDSDITRYSDDYGRINQTTKGNG